MDSYNTGVYTINTLYFHIFLRSSMNITPLWGNPFKKISPDIKDELKFLSSVPIFDSLSSRQLQKIHKLIHIREFVDGELIFRQGDPGVGMYIVRRGQVDVYKEYPDMNRAKITTMISGDFFGEISLLNDCTRSATIVSSKESTLLGLFRPDLFGLMDSDPKLGLRLIYRISQIVAERLRLSTTNSGD